MEEKTINCFDLINMTDECLFKGFFYDGFYETVNKKRDFVFEILERDLNGLFTVAFNMHEAIEWAKQKDVLKDDKEWYQKWEDEPEDMREIGEVIGKLILKDQSTIKDICDCYDAYYLGKALSYTEPKQFKEYLEKSKPNWEWETEDED